LKVPNRELKNDFKEKEEFEEDEFEEDERVSTSFFNISELIVG